MEPITTEFYDFRLIFPEITLAIFAIIGLIFGVYDKKRAYNAAALIAVVGFATVAYMVHLTDQYLVALKPEYVATAFNNLFRFDPFAAIMKSLVLLGGAVTAILSWRYLPEQKDNRHEFYALMMLSTLGMMVMLSANNFLTLYVGLELQSLALYVLAAFHRDSVRSTEAGIKYFVLGALSSGMLLFGISFIYGFSGTTDFYTAARMLSGVDMKHSLGIVTGVVFMLAGLAFKVSAVPFHMWTPDVYEGAPTPVTAFFAVAPKIAALGLLVRVLAGPLSTSPHIWQQVIIFLAAASMLVGAVAALRQTNIKRLMAYSSIGHMGFVLMGIAAASTEGVRALTAYMIIYVIMSVGAFACILSMRRDGKLVEKISDLTGLSKTNPIMALCLLVILFSMAGIPPLAGFFAKFYVIIAALHSNLYWLAVFGVVASVISAYYYLNIIKIMYFDDVREALDKFIHSELRLVMVGSALLLALFVIYPDPVMHWSERASSLIYSVGDLGR
ncbi:MAG: NADH-quinone oxidoreductase subunit NuoN [Alphaproteobacteria bacterium]|nr:MAG: NADH-quinone oxidoreductase subunit NuoN [Alphaproteobacteria bacterium]